MLRDTNTSILTLLLFGLIWVGLHRAINGYFNNPFMTKNPKTTIMQIYTEGKKNV